VCQINHTKMKLPKSSMGVLLALVLAATLTACAEGADNSEYTAVSRSKATAAVEVTDNLRTMLGLDLATV
jgi:hypothetical protein